MRKLIVLTAAIALVASAAHAKPRRAGDPGAQEIGGRPTGCPHAYCGCGLARFLGLEDARLNLAAAWERLFPRTQAKPGAVALRRDRHHVLLLIKHLSGSIWLTRDYNSTKHLSWIHARDVSNFVFVDPRRKVASR